MSADEGLRERLEALGGAGPDREGVAFSAFAPLATVWRAARESGVLFLATDADALVLRGVRACTCLQGQLSNDVASLEIGDGLQGAHLDRKGRMLALGTVRREAEDRYVVSASSAEVAVLERRLAAPAMLADVDLARQAPLCRFLVVGPRAEALLHSELGAAPPWSAFAHRSTADGGGRVEAWPLLGLEAWRVELAPGDAAPFLRRALAAGLEPAGGELHATLRVEAGTPAWGHELDERTLPPEARLEHALDYEKGCYVGQETIARLRTYGQVRKRLGVVSAGEALPVGAELIGADGRVLGRTTTAAFSPALDRFVALAYLRVEADVPKAVLRVGPEGEPSVRVESLPLVAPRMAPALPGPRDPARTVPDGDSPPRTEDSSP